MASAILTCISDISTSPSNDYPPISSIPSTSPARLSHPSAIPEPFPSTPIPSSTLPATTSPRTILYLAYGSNLSAETFLGVRGIRPLSQINVSAPSLRLVFDLPGIPYREPCFANTAPRKLPDPPSFPPPPDFPHPPSSLTPLRFGDSKTLPGDPTWSKGLIGVVYEVTPEDYAKILATEGGGASYADVLVPCVPIPPRMTVPEKPPFPDLPRPFLAHTLYAPRIPSSSPEEGEGDGRWKMPRWMARLFLPVHREEGYAQPSARYLKLIRDGAREHELPDDYQAYLARLRPYTITTLRQRVGMVLFLVLVGPLFGLMLGLGRLLADEQGRVPRWYAGALVVSVNLVWLVYDLVFKPVFGDGERTVEVDDGLRRWSARRSARGWNRAPVVDEEKLSEKHALLGGE